MRSLRGGDFTYKLLQKGEKTGHDGVGVMVKLNLAKSVLKVKRVSRRIIYMRLIFQGKIMTIISNNRLPRGRSEEEKKMFQNDLSTEVQLKNGNFPVMSDLNGHLGTFANGYDGVHGSLGWEQQNRDGERILELAYSLDLIVGNTCFKKDAEKLIT